MKAIFFRATTVILFLLIVKPASADRWIDLKAGTAESNGIVSLQLNSAQDDRIYALSTRFGSNLLERRYYRELSVSYGRRYSSRFGSTSIYAGVGLAELDDREFDQKIEPVIPLVASFTLGKNLGLSWTATLNLNRIQPFIGIELGITLGQFR